MLRTGNAALEHAAEDAVEQEHCIGRRQRAPVAEDARGDEQHASAADVSLDEKRNLIGVPPDHVRAGAFRQLCGAERVVRDALLGIGPEEPPRPRLFQGLLDPCPLLPIGVVGAALGLQRGQFRQPFRRRGHLVAVVGNLSLGFLEQTVDDFIAQIRFDGLNEKGQTVKLGQLGGGACSI